MIYGSFEATIDMVDVKVIAQRFAFEVKYLAESDAVITNRHSNMMLDVEVIDNFTGQR